MKTQQDECYAAERRLERGRLFDSIEDAQRFVDELRDAPWWHAQQFDRHVLRIEVEATGRGVTRSGGSFDKAASAGLVELAPHGMHTREVLHEVAHVLARAVHGSQSHDPWWARTYLTLVSCVMGAEAYLTLQRSFDEQGVDYDVRTTPESKFAL